jgi:hypothetical protein
MMPLDDGKYLEKSSVLYQRIFSSEVYDHDSLQLVTKLTTQRHYVNYEEIIRPRKGKLIKMTE